MCFRPQRIDREQLKHRRVGARCHATAATSFDRRIVQVCICLSDLICHDQPAGELSKPYRWAMRLRRLSSNPLLSDHSGKFFG